MTDYDALRAAAKAATPGPWAFTGYSLVTAPDNGYDAWCNERLDQGHSLERYEDCAVCGTWTFEALGKVYPGRGCQLATEAYDRDPTVAYMPAHHGDTAINRHVADAAYIAAASPDVVLGLLDRLAAAEDALRARTEDVAAVLSEAFIEQGKEAIARAQDEAVTVIANRLRTQAIARFDRYGSRDVRGATLWDVSAFLTESLQELVASEAVEAAQDATTAPLTAAAPHSDQPDAHDGERGGEAGGRA